MAVWICVTGIFWQLYAWLPVNADQEMFDYIGLAGSWGGHYYIDASDHNWPGAMFLHEISVRLLGVHSWSFRVLDFGIMTVGASALSYLLRSGGQVLASWFVLPLYQLMYITSGVWFAGQRDVIAAHFLLFAAAFFSKSSRMEKSYLNAVAGALVACAVLIRPTYLSNLPYLAGLIVLLPLFRVPRSRISVVTCVVPIFWLLAGAAVVLSAALLWSWSSGNLGALVRASGLVQYLSVI